jgi:hypothetical protein
MKPITLNLTAFSLVLGASLALGCSHQKEPEVTPGDGRAEEAGEDADEKADEAKDDAEEAADDAEDAADEAAEDASN